MLAYVFWHRPREGTPADAYEHAQLAFHRSLARARPVGMRCSAVFKLDEVPWAVQRADDEARDRGQPGYEDWYLLEDFAALGVLNEAAVGRGHRTTHDEAARRFGGGAGGLYALVEGCRSDSGERRYAARRGQCRDLGRAAGGGAAAELGELLGDGMDPRHASLWRRQLVLGPASEFCLLVREESVFDQPAGVAPTRLPDGWSATVLRREVLWHG